MAGRIVTADCLEWMREQPDGIVDLVVTSPPYEDARLYKPLEFKARGQDWVEWMIPRVVEACRITAGLVFVNMAGKRRNWKYSPVVEWLVADLTRQHGIVCGPAPYVFYRVGIPGSGSGRYHRRDWEPIYAFARPENVPPKWTDNTAMGHPPKWAPGGEMSNRMSDGKRVNAFGVRTDVPIGTRSTGDKDASKESYRATKARKNQWGHSYDSGATVVDPDGSVRSEGTRPSHKLASRNQWGGTGGSTANRKPNGERDSRARPSHERTGRRVITKPRPGMHAGQESTIYSEPVLADPGNVIQEHYTAEQVAELLADPGDVVACNVGGGVMGDEMCHDNEAPFPERLAMFFIRSFCQEGGTVLDPFCGSGTVPKVASLWGRNYIGIDVRESQTKLAERRLREHGQPLFA